MLYSILLIKSNCLEIEILNFLMVFNGKNIVSFLFKTLLVSNLIHFVRKVWLIILNKSK